MVHPIKTMVIGHVIDSLNELKGGPSVVCQRFCESLDEEGVQTVTFSNNYPEYGTALLPSTSKNLLFESSVLTRRFGGMQLAMRKCLCGPVGGTLDLIHTHGLWLSANVYARQAAQKMRIPLVISPRGMLEPWAMRRHWVKKKLCWLGREHRNLSAASGYHATSDQEAVSLREIGLRGNIAVIPNGVDVPLLKDVPSRSRLEGFLREPQAPYVLFLSRLHPKKGLDGLFNVWKTIVQEHPEHTLVIAGEGDPVYVRKLKAQIDPSLKDRIVFTGALYGLNKSAALAHADVFVLPSYSENFGMVVAESLAHCTPVITTEGTPWKALSEKTCGWWIPVCERALKTALLDALSLTEGERKQMGHRGRAFIEAGFTWPSVAQSMHQYYRWLLGEGDCPDFVMRD